MRLPCGDIPEGTLRKALVSLAADLDIARPFLDFLGKSGRLHLGRADFQDKSACLPLAPSVLADYRVMQNGPIAKGERFAAMSDMTSLDLAHAAMEAAPDDDATRLRFYQRLADTELFLLLENDAADDTILPQVFDTADGQFVMAFDSEDRLAAFTGAPSPYAGLPGRVIAGQLAGQGIGIGLNLGVAPSSFLMPAGAIDWLMDMLSTMPEGAEGRPETFHAPHALPEKLLTALDGKLAMMVGLGQQALLTGVTYVDGRRGHMLAFTGAPVSAQPALANAVSEALRFSGVEAAELDVTFLAADDPALSHLRQVALAFDLPAPVPEQVLVSTPAAPGTDPTKPPRLR